MASELNNPVSPTLLRKIIKLLISILVNLTVLNLPEIVDECILNEDKAVRNSCEIFKWYLLGLIGI